MQGIFRKENTDKALKYGIYRHLPTYEKIIRNLVSFFVIKIYNSELLRLRLGKFLHGVSESADLLYDNSVDKKDKEVDLAPDDIKGYVMQRKK